MVVKHSTTIRGIDQDPLPTRAIHITVTLKHLGTASRRAALTTLVDVGPVHVGAPAHADRVLLAGCGLGAVVAAADAGAEEEVVVR